MFRKFLVLFLVILTLVIGMLGNYLFKARNIPKDFIFSIPSGASLTYVGKQLKKDHIIDKTKLFINLLDYLELERGIIAGDYKIEQGENLYNIIKKITQGKIVNYKLTIYEGSTTKEIQKSINNNPHIIKTNFIAKDNYKEISGVELKNLEGIFYPDTYYYTTNTTDQDIYEKAFNKMESTLTDLWNTRDNNLPYNNIYEALIMASIIEKETHILEEKPLVSAVFVNRLKNSMRLQADPTIVYGLGNNYKGYITKRALARDSVYNTYTRRGLPPTPICNPSKQSIVAALKPARKKYLYFALNIHGRHIFSHTLKEHILVVQEYRKHKKIHKKMLNFLLKIAEI